MSTNPWDVNFQPAAVEQDLVKTVEAAVAAGEQAVTSATPSAQNVAQDATQAVENAVTGAVSSVVPAVTGAITSTVSGGGGGGSFVTPTAATSITGTLENVITSAAKGSVEKALLGLAPELESELLKEWQSGLNKVIIKVSGGTTTPPVPNLEDFIRADARSRAFRTLIIGLFVAVLTGLGTAAGQLFGADWSTHNGQVAALTVAIGAVVTSVGAYLSRLVSEPEVTKPLTAQLPPKSS